MLAAVRGRYTCILLMVEKVMITQHFSLSCVEFGKEARCEAALQGQVEEREKCGIRTAILKR